MIAARLELVCKKLDTVSEAQFEFRQWVDSSWGGAQDLSCGAPACVLGHAATIPELQAAGMRICRSYPRSYEAFGTHISLEAFGNIYIGLEGESRLGYWAGTTARSLRTACTIFGVSMAEARYLFVPCREDDDGGYGFHDPKYRPGVDASPQEVAAHIRRFIRRRGLPRGHPDL
jgi:hypothetical protein